MNFFDSETISISFIICFVAMVVYAFYANKHHRNKKAGNDLSVKDKQDLKILGLLQDIANNGKN